VTLGMMLLVRGAAKGLADERRIEAPASFLNDLLRARAAGEGLLPPGIWLLLVLALAVSGLLRYTRFGRHLLAIGSNERTARPVRSGGRRLQGGGVHDRGRARRPRGRDAVREALGWGIPPLPSAWSST
jgi:ABC-type xylose transport system permease subunit